MLVIINEVNSLINWNIENAIDLFVRIHRISLRHYVFSR